MDVFYYYGCGNCGEGYDGEEEAEVCCTEEESEDALLDAAPPVTLRELEIAGQLRLDSGGK